MRSSLDPVNISGWKWSIFLDYTIETLLKLDLKEYPIDKQFIHHQSKFGTDSKYKEAVVKTWGCKTKKFSKVRAACVYSDGITSVLNLVIVPSQYYDIPFFGADFVTLPSCHLLALDLQPILNLDKEHTQFVWEKLMPLYNSWKDLFPKGGKIPEQARPFFSPGFLWSKVPIGEESDKLISDFLFPAFKDYLDLYMQISSKAEKVNNLRSSDLIEGQTKYLQYRAQNDPARGMLTRFFGSEWTEKYINEVLF